MAMIERIRKRRWMLMVMVGVGLLSFLIPFDAVNSLFGGSIPNVGVINGHEVTSQEWANTLKLLNPLFRDKQVSDGAQINDLTWQYLTDKYLYEGLTSESNITVDDDLMEELLFGSTVPNLVTQLVYNGAEINDTFRDSVRAEFAANPPLELAYRAWIGENYKKGLVESMVNKSIYANTIDAKMAFQESNNLAVVDFVFKSYAETADSTVTYTDSELKDYYDKHKNDRKYRQLQGRDVEYVAFSTNPTAADSALLKDELAELIPTFRSAENDSTYAKANAQNPSEAFTTYKDKTFSADVENSIKNAAIDSIIGPFASGNTMNLVKVISRGVNTDEVQVRHILMRDKITGAKILDSLNKTLSAGGSFDAFARMNEDPATQQKNGDMGNKKKSDLTTAYGSAFADAVFAMGQGSTQVIESTQGVHLVKIEGKNMPYTKIARIDRMIQASKSTNELAYNNAREFVSNSSDTTAFHNNAKSMFGGLVIQKAKDLKPNSGQSKQAAPELVDFAYGSELGDISQPMLFGTQYMVAALVDVREKGIPTFENAKEKMTADLIKEKKFQMYAEMMKGNSLEEIASKVASKVIEDKEVLRKASSLPEVGSPESENDLIGTCFGIASGKISEPIQGKAGVFVIRRDADVVAQNSNDNYLTDQEMLLASIKKSNYGNLLRASLVECLEVNDLRNNPN